MKIICINGQGGVGKDEFVKAAQINSKQPSYIYNFSMVENIKAIAKYIGWQGGKTNKDRKFLSDLKDLTARYSDYPFQSVVNLINARLWWTNYNKIPTKDFIIFIHAREPKDIQRWKEEYGAKSLLIRREEVERTYGNHADDQVFDIDYDYIYNNNKSLEELEKDAVNFVQKIRLEDWHSFGPGIELWDKDYYTKFFGYVNKNILP